MAAPSPRYITMLPHTPPRYTISQCYLARTGSHR